MTGTGTPPATYHAAATAALLSACHGFEWDDVRIHLAAGADPNGRSSDGDTPLLLVVGLATDAQLELLLDAGADVNATDALGDTVLMRAIMQGQSLVGLRRLLRAGPDLSARCPSDGYTALHQAIAARALKTALLLVKAGAPLGIKDGRNRTPLEFLRILGGPAAGNRTPRYAELVALMEQKLAKQALARDGALPTSTSAPPLSPRGRGPVL